jgi:hypothetical protein
LLDLLLFISQFFDELECCLIKVDFFSLQAEDSQGAGMQTPIETYARS